MQQSSVIGKVLSEPYIPWTRSRFHPNMQYMRIYIQHSHHTSQTLVIWESTVANENLTFPYMHAIGSPWQGTNLIRANRRSFAFDFHCNLTSKFTIITLAHACVPLAIFSKTVLQNSSHSLICCGCPSQNAILSPIHNGSISFLIQVSF